MRRWPRPSFVWASTPGGSASCRFSALVCTRIDYPQDHLLVAKFNSERSAAALNILNFAWALGAVAGPSLIALFASDGRLLRPLIGLAALLSGIALLVARRSVSDSSTDRIRRKPNRKISRALSDRPCAPGPVHIFAVRRASLYLCGNGGGHRRMDRLLCAPP